MKSKKGIIILSTVVLACAVGFIVSPLVDWPVDKSNASGNIAKSSRFSRKTAAESLTNMEELLANDEEFKNNISAIYVVMQTRALQFASLVDMSNEVAGDIPAYASVLKDMNAAREVVNNVNAQVAAAGADLNAALAGESRPDLTQNTINASLAYSTLQKQNKLATRFIDTTDKYLETSEASDQLKLVRDQWVNYQQVTAALEGDEKAAEELAKKGNLLTGEQTMVAFGEFGLNEQAVIWLEPSGVWPESAGGWSEPPGGWPEPPGGWPERTLPAGRGRSRGVLRRIHGSESRSRPERRISSWRKHYSNRSWSKTHTRSPLV